LTYIFWRLRLGIFIFQKGKRLSEIFTQTAFWLKFYSLGFYYLHKGYFTKRKTPNGFLIPKGVSEFYLSSVL